ncbi:MAG: SCO family protein [Ferruginibacter sp.]
MNKTAILGLMLAILLPITGYMLVKFYSKDAVLLPSRYFYDSVIVSEKNGRKTSDTIWHKVTGPTFTNQLGKQVTIDSLHGKILVVNFFFSRCPSICPGLARNMSKLQESFIRKNNDTIVQFISVSIDPIHDSVAQLRKFANRYTANHDNWWFLTGDKKAIYDFALHELKANIADPGVDTAFIHTENFFLLDKDRVVRGWYNGFDSVQQAKLVRDIPILLLEKSKKRSFGEFLKELFGRS